jgi:hypothetical protein
VLGPLLLPKPLIKGRGLWAKRVSPGYAQGTQVVFWHDQCRVAHRPIPIEQIEQELKRFRVTLGRSRMASGIDFSRRDTGPVRDLTQFILAAGRNALATMDDFTMPPHRFCLPSTKTSKNIKLFRRLEGSAPLSQMLTHK